MTVLDLSIPTPTKNNRNNPLLPNNIRACIIGKSGCGKTNLLMNLLLGSFGKDLKNPLDWLDYTHLTIYSRSLHQPEYKLLNSCFLLNNSKEDILDCIKNKKNPVRKHFSSVSEPNSNRIFIETYSSDAEIKDPTDFDINNKNLIIFDDVMLENQKTIESFYTRGRHNNIDCIYISQNYTKLPRHTIRENSNLFFIFEQDNITIRNFYNDHCTDISFEDFKELCSESWKEKFGFVLIDMTKSKFEGKYRKGLDEFFFPLEK